MGLNLINIKFWQGVQDINSIDTTINFGSNKRKFVIPKRWIGEYDRELGFFVTIGNQRLEFERVIFDENDDVLIDEEIGEDLEVVEEGTVGKYKIPIVGFLLFSMIIVLVILTRRFRKK